MIIFLIGWSALVKVIANQKRTNISAIKGIVRKNNGIVTAKEISSAGIDSWYLTSMVKNNDLERVARGVYFDSTSNNYDELYFFQLRNKACIYSYQTALYLYNLTDRMPFINEVTVCQGYNTWRIKNDVEVHQIEKKWYRIGITHVRTVIGNYVMVYNMERTICDLVRNRRRQDSEIFGKALRAYVRNPKKDVHRLREYAKQFGILRQVDDILEILDE